MALVIYYSDGLLHIDYSTGITSVPDIVHGELNMKDLSPRYKSGVYNPQGTTASRVQVSRLDIVPKSPFAFSTKWWSKLLFYMSQFEKGGIVGFINAS